MLRRITCAPIQRRSQDICLGGGHPADATRYILRHLREPTRFSGGGVVADIFRDLHERTRFAGGGGTEIPGDFAGLLTHSKNVTG